MARGSAPPVVELSVGTSSAKHIVTTGDAIHSIAAYRGISQLSDLYACKNNWDVVKKARHDLTYSQLCQFCFIKSSIHCLLLDDCLSGSISESVKWHDFLVDTPSKRIVRIEALAQVSLDTRNLRANHSGI